MAYLALYRSYRPSTFEEVAGQQHIIKTLQNAVNSNRISHAYLFSGPRGIGKTTIARILARAINCKNPISGTPCNECESCKQILQNETSDIIELDAASNNGVDEIRGLLEKVNFLPSTLNKKVYIIDEVHMLSISAFNALLKTLEEPPAHVVFILATTEPHKVPATILSRCQRFNFKPLNTNEIFETLKKVSLKEKVDISDEALVKVSEASDGGMRDALSILDQVIAYSDGEITLDDVYNVTGKISDEKLIDLMECFNNHQTAESIKILNELLDMGKEASRLIQSLLQLSRDILLYQNANTKENHKSIFDDPDFQKLASHTERRKIFHYIDILNDTQNKIKYNVSQKIYLEVAIIKLSSVTKEEYAPALSVQEQGNDTVVYASNSELEEKMAQLETYISRLRGELTRLGLSDFKEHVISKMAFLEDIASKAVASVKDSEKIELLERKIVELQESPDVQLEGIENRILELATQVNELKQGTATKDKEESVDKSLVNELSERIDYVQNIYNVLNAKVDDVIEMSKNVKSQVQTEPIEENEEHQELHLADEIIYEEPVAEEFDNFEGLDELIVPNESASFEEITKLTNAVANVNQEVEKISSLINAIEHKVSESEASNNDILNKYNELNVKVENIKIPQIDEEYILLLSAKIENVKEYGIKLGARVADVEEKLRNNTPQTKVVEVKQVVVEKEEPKVVNKPEVQEQVLQPIIEKMTPQMDDVTSKAYDVKKIEEAMHQSRDPKAREEKIRIASTWKRLGDRVGASLASVAKILTEGMFVVNGFNTIIITYPNASVCNHLMSEKIHFDAKQILKAVYSKDYDFIALPENTWQEKRNEYHGQYQIGVKYPKLSPIVNSELRVLNITKETFDKERSEAIQKAEELFGKSLIREGE